MELREQIEQILETSWIVDQTQIHDNYDLDIEKATNGVLTVVKEAGYRKIPDVNRLVMLMAQLEEIGYRGMPLADRVHRFLVEGK